jgi:undecaprenyl-diphosphatase
MLASRVMPPFQAIALGIIQGLTEFLPVSSSAHLYLVPTLLGWKYGGLAFDVALHWGTLLALLLAFWRDWWELLRAPFMGTPQDKHDARATWLKLAAASVPAAVAGVLLEPYAERWLRSLPVQATTLVVFGFLLWWVDRVRPQREPLRSRLALPSFWTCLGVGAAQALALVPGVSRSGVTITASRSCSPRRSPSARGSWSGGTSPRTFRCSRWDSESRPPRSPGSLPSVASFAGSPARASAPSSRIARRWR